MSKPVGRVRRATFLEQAPDERSQQPSSLFNNTSPQVHEDTASRPSDTAPTNALAVAGGSVATPQRSPPQPRGGALGGSGGTSSTASGGLHLRPGAYKARMKKLLWEAVPGDMLPLRADGSANPRHCPLQPRVTPSVAHQVLTLSRRLQLEELALAPPQTVPPPGKLAPRLQALHHYALLEPANDADSKEGKGPTEGGISGGKGLSKHNLRHARWLRLQKQKRLALAGEEAAAGVMAPPSAAVRSAVQQRARARKAEQGKAAGADAPTTNAETNAAVSEKSPPAGILCARALAKEKVATGDSLTQRLSTAMASGVEGGNDGSSPVGGDADAEAVRKQAAEEEADYVFNMASGKCPLFFRGFRHQVAGREDVRAIRAAVTHATEAPPAEAPGTLQRGDSMQGASASIAFSLSVAGPPDLAGQGSVAGADREGGRSSRSKAGATAAQTILRARSKSFRERTESVSSPTQVPTENFGSAHAALHRVLSCAGVLRSMSQRATAIDVSIDAGMAACTAVTPPRASTPLIALAASAGMMEVGSQGAEEEENAGEEPLLLGRHRWPKPPRWLRDEDPAAMVVDALTRVHETHVKMDVLAASPAKNTSGCGELSSRSCVCGPLRLAVPVQKTAERLATLQLVHMRPISAPDGTDALRGSFSLRSPQSEHASLWRDRPSPTRSRSPPQRPEAEREGARVVSSPLPCAQRPASSLASPSIRT